MVLMYRLSKSDVNFLFKNKTNNQSTFMKNKLLLSLSLIFIMLSQAWAQTQAITGKVTDSSTGQGLPGVTVLVKGTSVGTSTDINGNYSITPPAGATTLTFSFVGYTTTDRAIGNATTLNITLTADANQLNEVVVTGYTTQTKREVTGAVSQVSGEELANVPMTSVDKALQGRVAGLQSVGASGQPGSAQQIR
ncbi:MAG: hypothetical protein COW65_16960, partial [Cytophagales bacterium CG18_big_fil_WC_8_21_14_2_50_42_9]